ncbi:AraC family transcriptional regulator [Mucilaginibacter sp. AK015]|uniref:helix-turn-helix domain-containing protein n=1 Tax=Mucilaginibacter sp. AK015 TaxID=2723072 RepID=UPI00161386FF|nr:helix-turn-helix domain-containing protein [Mucilaginibacter sp. AK015]MBB5394799.1 AraC-like DNA-binding protein [Mucilaginibacter sp. AK015]
MVQHTEINVLDEITHSIHGFWYREIDLGPMPASFEVLPDGHAEIIFHFGCDLMLEGQPIPLPSPFMVGLLYTPIYFQTKGRVQVIGIKCLPWAVYDLLDLPLLTGGVQSFSHPIASLQPELQHRISSGEIDAALGLVRDWCLKRRTGIAPELKKAGKAMLASNGSLPVNSIAETAHTTVRTLERKFKASSGHTPKDVSGLIRFEQACERLWDNPEISISALAHELGYADQSHMNREFKRYSGNTAAAFVRQTQARKKELGDNFVAIVLSS